MPEIMFGLRSQGKEIDTNPGNQVNTTLDCTTLVFQLTDTRKETVAPVPVDAPSFWGTNFQASWTSNTVVIVVSRLVPSQTVSGPAFEEPVAILHLSPQSALDLWLLIGDGLKRHDDKWGALATDYSTSRPER